jgi:NitT/TauT family transport system permease protein
MWEFGVKFGGISETVLPAPTSIIKALGTHFFKDLLPYFFETVFVIFAGFIIGAPLGITLAAILSQFVLLKKTFHPFVIMLCTTPLITLIPLFMLWLGYDMWVKIVIVVFQMIPIIALNSITGFSSIESSKLELMDAYGASKKEKFFKAIFPNALPNVFTGIRLSSIFATIATISCEFTGFKGGLGTRVVYYAKFIQTDLVFAIIVVIAFIGLAMFSLVNFIESKVVRWNEVQGDIF